MVKSEILQKLVKIKKIKRELEDLAKELNIGDISEDKIYISIVTYYSILNGLLQNEDVDIEREQG